jgi:hypothetical protein
MVYTAEMALCDMIYVPNFMKFGAGVQAILRFCLRNLRDCNVGIMNYAAKMDSAAMIYIPSFIKIGSGFQKLVGGGLHTHTRR